MAAVSIPTNQMYQQQLPPPPVRSGRHTFRNLAGAILVNIAVLLAGLSLLAFLGSLTLLHGEQTLSDSAFDKARQTVMTQIGNSNPVAASDPQATTAIQQALQNPAIVEKLSQSEQSGSQALSDELARLDPSLAPSLAQTPLSIDTGMNLLSDAEKNLHQGAILGSLLAALLAASALVVTTRRDRVLRRLGRWAISVSIVAVLIGWVLPWWLESHATGTVQSLATFLNNTQSTAHIVYLVLFVSGVAMLVLASMIKRVPRLA
jgi:hypothetical protein